LKELSLKDVNGGTSCAVCSVLTGLMQQLAEIHNSSVAEAIDAFCQVLPQEVQKDCTEAVSLLTPEMLELLESRETPDVICNALGVCRNDTGKFCRLFPPPKLDYKEDIQSRVAKTRSRITPFPKGAFINICDIGILKPVCNALNNHTPLADDDGDLFSTERTLRGSYWRGKDCNDGDKDIYPGRLAGNDSSTDTNCNGIMGVDASSGKTYESLWCSGTQQMGTIILGDSASAHFHIPPAWLTSREMLSPDTYKDLVMILENEFDWPMMSTMTGFTNSTWPVSISGKVDSTYLRLLELNRCNHRDYQNIAVNGARASAMASDIVKTLARRGSDDKPVFLSLALIGNDVCNGHPGMDHMTKPEDFYTHTLETLTYVDQHVAPGSFVLGVGLVDGRVLYEILANRTHPIGSLHNDINYSDVYDYLNCLEISPCFGWLNSNATWRNLTTQRAMQLNDAFRKVIANNTFKNIKVSYIDPPLPAAIQDWKKMGKDPLHLIEPVDGFHPSQAGNALNTELTFQLLAKMEGVLPKRNPFNDEIKAKFGDQGGYL
jgi:acyloxyacyl hydrolase